MPPFTRDNLIRAFQKLEIGKSGSLRGFIVNEHGKKLFPPVYFNKNIEHLPPSAYDAVRKSLHLTRPQFRKLLSCTLGRSEYLAIRAKADRHQ